MRIHAQWINERHSFGHFDLTPLNATPERVRARGTVYWQAEFPGRPAPNVIKAVVGEDWILERAASGALKFVLYINTFHRAASGFRAARFVIERARERRDKLRLPPAYPRVTSAELHFLRYRKE